MIIFSWLTPLLTFLLPLVSVFLILLILIQRGRGGGLVGAFGGAGGQSAFGAKAGDLFTKITVVTVCIWLAICIFLLPGLKHGNSRSGGFGDGGGTPAEPAATAPADSSAPATTTTPAAAPATPSAPVPASTPAQSNPPANTPAPASPAP